MGQTDNGRVELIEVVLSLTMVFTSTRTAPVVDFQQVTDIRTAPIKFEGSEYL
jgi:hypothetical protein